ncbi:hypothetical protein O6H91_11G082800 [Diphasiastrum complanatum]|uniref:Uncharacterized protein n=1 Tax=Diphasiastrum complanatum TaxID=34168 RepID=A0ACC2CB38_DIPCM|nr:hypothetical protein O6H91_11G082800 [Diphasiastrum complanatum]
MAQSLADELVQLIKGFSATLAIKLSHLIAFVDNHKNASSFGAVAGLAIALLCTWQYLKLQDHRRKRVPKPESSSSSSTAVEGDATATSTAVAKGITQPIHRGGLSQEPSASTQVPVAQLVRRQLLGGRKMTCELLGVVLQESTAEELQKHVVVRPSVVEVLLELTRVCDTYLFAKVLDDESEAAVLAALDAVGAFTLGALNRNKVLFYSIETGGASFVRQLEPDWHVDSSLERVEQLARFIPHLLHVAPFGASTFSGNVITTESLEDYFAVKNQN